MCIVHSTLRAAISPYTNRFEKNTPYPGYSTKFLGVS